MFASIEQRYGVPPGPLIAIWGMETGFGSQRGNQNMLSSIATLAYDCRRSDYFTEHLYAALQLIDRGALSASQRGSMHGEVGQTQFMPKNILAYGIGNLDSRRQRADLDREFPQSPWLARRRRLPAGRGQLRRHPGLECRRRLSEGDRADGPPDRRRRVRLELGACRPRRRPGRAAGVPMPSAAIVEAKPQAFRIVQRSRRGVWVSVASLRSTMTLLPRRHFSWHDRDNGSNKGFACANFVWLFVFGAVLAATPALPPAAAATSTPSSRACRRRRRRPASRRA